MPIDLGGTALPQLVALLYFSPYFSFLGRPFLIGRLQAENLLDFMQTEKGRAWKCYKMKKARTTATFRVFDWLIKDEIEKNASLE